MNVARALTALILLVLPALSNAAEVLRPTPAAEQVRSTLTARYEQEIKPLLSTYCGACHGASKHKGDIDFSRLTNSPAALAQRDLWRRTAEQVATQEMPPESETRQPNEEERGRLLAWLGALKHLDPPDPGASPLRPLSRSEYARTMRDLMGVDFPAGTELPHGSGEEVALSPLMMEKYLLAAEAMLDQVVVPEQLVRQWNPGQLDALIEGTVAKATPDEPTRTFTTAAEIAVTVSIPSDGTYTLKLKAGADAVGKEPPRLAIRSDNQVLDEIKVTAPTRAPATYTTRLKLPPGRTRLAINFINPFTEVATKDAGGKSAPISGKNPGSGKAPAYDAGKPKVRAVTLVKIDLTGPPAAAQTPAHRRLFIAVPTKDLAPAEAARAIIAPFALRAFRRPPTTQEIERLLSIFALAEAQGESFTSAVTLMLKAVLVSPQFLYRTPEDRPGLKPGIVPVGDFELASRLSYFFWSTMPDDELFAAARSGTLHQPDVLSAQVRRLITDPRSRALIDDFVAPWLGLDLLPSVVVDERLFPQLTPEVRQAMYDEGTLLVETIMREDRSLLELIASDYTFVNAGLARWYGLVDIKGTKLQRVTLSDPNRGGVMTLPGVLTVTAMSTRTSPVKRGKWVLEQLLGTTPPPPPPNVAALEKQDTPENAKLTVRQKTELHRRDPTCAGCHRVMDAIGFGLENFDSIGRWRERDDNGTPVDCAGELPGRQRFSSPAELKRILLTRKDAFTRTLAAKLLSYALGRGLSGYDEVVLDRIVENVAKDGYRFGSLLREIALSYPFGNMQSPVITRQ